MSKKNITSQMDPRID
jgi:dynein light chain LC8-type